MSKIGIYTSSSGIYAYQDALDVVANNIANVNTNGFKSSRASFSDLLYTKTNPNNDKIDEGHGIQVEKTDLMFEQSGIHQTGQPLDFAALDESFFAVEALSGNTLYTKNGSFHISKNAAGTWELCSFDGGYVLDDSGNHIEIPYDEKTDTYDYSNIVNLIGTYKFPNPYGLDQTGSNYYTETKSSGTAQAAPDAEIRQGYVETSSTSVAREMTSIIELQRAFQLNVSMLKTNDAMNNLMNNLKN
jgi:flagellar basal-body rod protein FlgG